VLATARRVAVLIDRGELEEADDLLADAGLATGDAIVALRYVRGRLHAAADRPGEALADLFRCGQQLAARNADRPAALPWRSAAAATLAATGATESAARLVADEVALARHSGTASALGRALRVQGKVLPGPEGMAAVEEAVRVLERAPRRFELAQALVEYGRLLNAAKRRQQARRVLRDGLELAERCGSPALVAQARAAYLAAGGKRRPTVPPRREEIS
jgi:tetratricopeptide (TPR) repeat protein